MENHDIRFMRIAIESAEAARRLNEVPVGACIIDGASGVLALAGNRSIIDRDPTAHAEILVLREAAKKVDNYRLTECTLYTTIEPCVMCAGALVNARIKRLVFGAADERYGAVTTKFGLCDHSLLNHKIEIQSGVLAQECGGLIKDFFRDKRTGAQRPIE